MAVRWRAHFRLLFLSLPASVAGWQRSSAQPPALGCGANTCSWCGSGRHSVTAMVAQRWLPDLLTAAIQCVLEASSCTGTSGLPTFPRTGSTCRPVLQCCSGRSLDAQPTSYYASPCKNFVSNKIPVLKPFSLKWQPCFVCFASKYWLIQRWYSSCVFKFDFSPQVEKSGKI